MRKVSKILAYLAFAFGVAVSWAQTADQTPSARDRLAQAIETSGESKLPRNVQTNQKSNGSVPAAGTSKKTAGLVDRATQYITRTILPGFSEIPKNISGDGSDEGDAGQTGGLWDWMSNAGNANSAGNGSGNGQSNSGAGNKIVMNDNAQAQDPNASAGDKPKPISPPSTRSGGEGAGVTGSAKPLPKWWPMCAFVDQSVSDADANKIFKELVDDAAQLCQVHIQVFAVKANWDAIGDDYATINDLTRKKCNLPNGLQGSATALVPFPLTAAKMCDSKKKDKDGNEIWDEKTAGCAELSSKSSTTKEDMGDGHSHSKASGNVAVSIEVPNGHSADIVAHEAIGHSQMGQPNGETYGNGIGPKSDLHPPPGERVKNTFINNWTPPGCEVMRANAHDNTAEEVAKYFGSARRFLYDSNIETYMIPSGKIYDMRADPGLFEKRKPVPPPGPMLAQQPPPAGGAVRTAQKPSGGKTIDPAEDVFASNKVGTPEPDESIPEKHKKGPKIPDASVASIRASEQAVNAKAAVLPNDPNEPVNVAFEGPKSGPTYSKGNKIKFADSNSPGPRSTGAGKYDESVYVDMFSGKSAGGSSGSNGGSSSTGSLTYDDNAEVNPLAGTMDSGPSRSGGGFGPMNGSVGTAMGDAFDFNSVGGAAAGGGNSKPGFDNKVFNVGMDSAGQEEEEEGAERLRRNGEGRRRDAATRRPASDDNSGLVRVNKPEYRGGGL